MTIFEIAKNGIWSKKFFIKLFYLISRVFLAWTFLNFLAHCDEALSQEENQAISDQYYPFSIFLAFGNYAKRLIFIQPMKELFSTLKFRREKLIWVSYFCEGKIKLFQVILVYYSVICLQTRDLVRRKN